MANDIKLLDCTLRDGGYVNNWNWGFTCARNIISSLIKANVDIVEVGFLRNVDKYDPNVTVCNSIEELNKLLPDCNSGTMFSAMAMRSNYDLSKLAPYSGHGIEMIRITAHEYDIKEGLEFAKEVQNRGYKVSINPINIMGYSDEQILWILNHVNQIHPYQFSIVDTFGSMKRRDLDRIVSLVDHNLDRDIRVALHLHENMALSCALAQSFIDKHLDRPTSVDASLMGMGRIPGNLPIELISDYLNEYCDTHYDIDFMMDSIQDYIAPIKGQTKWGYLPAYYLSARHNLHRNYAEHYLGKGDLTHRDINHILSRIGRSKAAVFDHEYADQLYFEYKNNEIDDIACRKALRNIVQGKEILVIAPGHSIIEHKDEITRFIKTKNPLVFSLNFESLDFPSDYCFFSNNKRLSVLQNTHGKIITTSNVDSPNSDFVINHNSLASDVPQGCNSLLLCLRLLKDLDASNVSIAGADGYGPGKNEYFDTAYFSITEHNNSFNLEVGKAIKKIGLDITFLTPSKYDI